MATHNDLGKLGEALAGKFLKGKQFHILDLNWRYAHYEIDIIASKEGILHFIEVKTRRSQRYGFPEESVDKKKMQKLMNAAEEYLYLCPGWKRVQYDVLSIMIGSSQPEFFFIEDIYL